MPMDTVLYIEITMFGAVILTIILLKTLIFKPEETLKTRLFLLSTGFVILTDVFDSMWKLCDAGYWKLPVFIILSINFLRYMLLGIALYFWVLYSEAKSAAKSFKYKMPVIIAAAPLAILSVLLIISSAKGYMFHTEGNKSYYTKGPVYYTQQILAYAYILAVSVRVFVTSIKNKQFIKKDGLMTVACVSFIPLGCGIVQVIFPELPFLTPGMTAALLLEYVNYLLLLGSVDSLTGIINRKELLKKLEEKVLSLKKGERLYFLFLDIDSFKRINDLYGHNEGDKVLKMVASVLRCVCRKTKGICARYGGDEFAVVQVLDEDGDIALVRKDIYLLVKERGVEMNLPYEVSVSIGCMEYTDKTGSIEELINFADNNMYYKKSKRKQELIINNGLIEGPSEAEG